jgi:hypothetical protein
MILNLNFVLLFICTNFIYGIMVTLPSMISKICEPFNNYALGGPLAASFLFTGIVVCFLMGFLLDKVPCYKALNIFCCVFTFILCFMILWAIHIKSVVFMFVCFALFGTSVVP